VNRAESTRLLAMCAAYDNRTVGEAAASAWALALVDVPFDDAGVAVVEHYRHSRDWVMPADIRRLVLSARGQRLARAEDVVPAADPDDVSGYLAALRQGRHREADQLKPRPVRELLSGAFRRPEDALPPEQSAARARALRDQLPRRTA
jgi:hypothetical protein